MIRHLTSPTGSGIPFPARVELVCFALIVAQAVFLVAMYGHGLWLVRPDDERRAERACDHVGGGRHLADVELNIAHHSPERPDDGDDLDEVGLDSRDRSRPALDILGMAVGRDRNLQSGLCHCFSMPAFSITAAHFLTSAAMRSRISWGVLPRASMPSVDAVAWRAGSDSAALMC